jgi:hypothetical protein
MGLWQVPEKILLPAEPCGAFELNGRLPTGEQVMAYARTRYEYAGPGAPPAVRGHTAVLFRFDADGVLRTCEFGSAPTWEEARAILNRLAGKLAAEGWISADILVRPFYVVLDGLATGLVYWTDGEDDGEEADYSPEEVRLVPFDKIFHRPWTMGNYDT